MINKIVLVKAWYNRGLREGTLDLRYLVLWFMAAVYPLVVVPNPWGYTFPLLQNVIQVPPSYFCAPKYVLLALAAVLALALLLRDRPPGRRRELIPLAFFVFFAFVATSLAAYPGTAWFGTPMRYTGLTTYLYCMMLFLLAAYTLNPGRTGRLLKWMVVTASAVALLAVLQYCGLDLVPHEKFRDGSFGYGTMANRNFLGTYMVFILPAALSLFLRRRAGLWLACSALIYAGLLVSLTRGVWLVGAGCFLFFAWRAFKRPDGFPPAPSSLAGAGSRAGRFLAGLSGKKAFLVLALTFVLVTAVLAPIREGMLLSRSSTVTREITAAAQFDERAGSSRMFIWRETLRLWLARSDVTLFGLGPDHLIYAQIITPENSLVDKAHNIYLEMAVTLGGCALLAYLVFLALILRGLRGGGGNRFFTVGDDCCLPDAGAV